MNGLTVKNAQVHDNNSACGDRRPHRHRSAEEGSVVPAPAPPTLVGTWTGTKECRSEHRRGTSDEGQWFAKASFSGPVWRGMQRTPASLVLVSMVDVKRCESKPDEIGIFCLAAFFCCFRSRVFSERIFPQQRFCQVVQKMRTFQKFK